MATAAQVLANRENAQLSTGPTTVEGKAKASQNAVRHNLTARGLIVPLGLEQAFAEVEAILRDSLAPLADLQELVFKRILECAWNLERCRLAEATLFAQSDDKTLDPLLDTQADPQYARIQKYARQNENSMLKWMRELSRIQTEFQFRQEVNPLTAEQINTPEIWAQAPQSLSAICNYQKVLEATQHSAKRDFQNGANRARATLDSLKNMVMPTPVDPLLGPPCEMGNESSTGRLTEISECLGTIGVSTVSPRV